MRLTQLSPFLAFIVTTTASWHNDFSLTEDSHPLLKRWYGVQPNINDPKTQKSGFYPWPVRCTDPQYYQPIYYCFKDHRSVNNLNDILLNAIAVWAHAIEATALSIDLPPPANGDPHVLCGDQRLAGYTDALVISDDTQDGNDALKDALADESACQTATTVGYQWIAAGEMPRPWRHSLRFCAIDYPTKAEKIQKMAHELGHAMGLQHEHQRPDRDQYLTFNCANLPEYAQAIDLVETDARHLFNSSASAEEDMTTSEKMQKVCTNLTLATAYLPTAIPYLLPSHLTTQNPTTNPLPSPFLANPHSTAFDYNSIMLYAGSPSKILVRKDTGKPTLMGGSSNPSKSRISAGDVARIAMLYDSHTEACTAAINGTNWGPVKVRMRGFEAVVQPPRGGNESFDVYSAMGGMEVGSGGEVFGML